MVCMLTNVNVSRPGIQMRHSLPARAKSTLGTTLSSAKQSERLARSKSFWLVLRRMSVSIAVLNQPNQKTQSMLGPPLTKPTPAGTTFCALSLRSEGYDVWANVEASGTTTEFIRDVSNDRMATAGVQLVSLFSIVCDLMRDWRNTPGTVEVLAFLTQYYPVYARVAAAHGAAVLNGTIIPGEEALLAPGL
jgi:hypothetical protein